MAIYAFDTDQVSLNFLGKWCEVAEETLGYPVITKSPCFPLNRRFGLDSESCNKVWKVFNTADNWGSIPFFPGVQQLLLSLLSRGDEVHFVTSVPNLAKEARIDFFARELPGAVVHQAESLDPSRPNGGKSKYDILKEICPVFYADDRWPHIQEALEARVPAVYRVHGGHDGNGDMVPGITEIHSILDVF